jgi:hypothetical protein
VGFPHHLAQALNPALLGAAMIATSLVVAKIVHRAVEAPSRQMSRWIELGTASRAVLAPVE